MNPVCDLPGASLSADLSGFPDPQIDLEADANASTAELVLAGGCFWCTEAVYRQLDGVLDVVSGYAGGTAETANYKDVCGGNTDHAEAIAISYQPAKISFGQLLKVFFSAAHDPTQLNRQGNDQGRQYRSAVFYIDDDQRDVASAYIDQLEEAEAFSAPVVTTLERLTVFYPGEAHHQDYAARNPAQSYIAAVSASKVAKLRKLYPNRLKPAGN